MTTRTMVTWIVSLVAEFLVVAMLARAAWRKKYPRFLAYLLFDLSASLLLFWVSRELPGGVYDFSWRIVQVGLLAGRMAATMEVYTQMAAGRGWRFSDGAAIPFAGLCALLAQAALMHPIIWPESLLEEIYSVAGSVDVFMACFLMLVMNRDRGPQWAGLARTHGKILCIYLFLTAFCYYAAALKADVMGTWTVAVAAICYLSWAICIGRAPAPETESSAGHAGELLLNGHRQR